MANQLTKSLVKLEAQTPPTIGATELGLYVDSSDGNKPKIRQGSDDYDLTQLLQLLSTNLIHNASLDIWQEGTSFVSPTSGTYLADGWQCGFAGAMAVTITRDTDVPTPSAGHDGAARINYSMKVDVTTADTSIAAGDAFILNTKIEGYTFNAVAQRKMVLSCWFKASKAGTYCMSVQNSGSNRSWVKEFVVSANVWTKLEMPIDPSPSAGTWDYTTGIGLSIYITLAAGSTFQTTQGAWQTGNFYATANQTNGMDDAANNFWITQFKLEPGDRQTIFVPESYTENWLRCQRYFHQSVADDFVIGSGVNALDMWVTDAYSTADAAGIYRFPVVMRTVPTVTVYSRNGTSAKTCTAVAPSVDVGTTVTVTNPSAKGVFRITDSGAGLVVATVYINTLKANARL